MPRWYNIVFAGLTWLGRLYGVFFLGLGVVFLYLGGRGLVAFKNGIRATWSDPTACVIGLLDWRPEPLGWLSLGERRHARKGIRRRPGAERQAHEDNCRGRQAGGHGSCRRSATS